MKSIAQFKKRQQTLLVIFVLFISSIIYYSRLHQPRVNSDVSMYGRWDSTRTTTEATSSGKVNFTGFNNQTGVEQLIVPNIIHYIRFNKTELSFVDYVCLRSAYLHHRPDRIFIHTNLPGSAVQLLKGTYWDIIRNSQSDLYDRISVLHLDIPTDIFGQLLSDEWILYHGSDIARIRTLMKYGGIYLDNDVYVVQSLDKYRRFEMVLGWDDGKVLANQVIVAHKDARFLPLWLDSYRDYYEELWYFNAGEKPTHEILARAPYLIHRVKDRFAGQSFLMPGLYDSNDTLTLREKDTVHLLSGHRHYLDRHYKEYPDFNSVNIVTYPYVFGHMARLVIN